MIIDKCSVIILLDKVSAFYLLRHAMRVLENMPTRKAQFSCASSLAVPC